METRHKKWWRGEEPSVFMRHPAEKPVFFNEVEVQRITRSPFKSSHRKPVQLEEEAFRFAQGK